MERVFLTDAGRHQWFDRSAVEERWETVLGGFTYRLFLTRLGAWVCEKIGPKSLHQVNLITAPEAFQMLQQTFKVCDSLSPGLRQRIQDEVGRFEV